MTAKIEQEGEDHFSVSGDMTFNTTHQLLLQSKNLFKKAKELHLNLTGVNRADSAGLALLLEWISQIEQQGGKVWVEGLPESLQTIAKLCQIETTLEKHQ